MITRRSNIFKQFLLRVHPDHFQRFPKAHDENLQSIQLLNQFMDSSQGGSYYNRHTTKTKVFFHVKVPQQQKKTTVEEETFLMKRVSLEFSSNIERNMHSILSMCGVKDLEDPVSSSPSSQSATTTVNHTSTHTNHPFHGETDFNMNAFKGQSASRKKRKLTNIGDFLDFMHQKDILLSQKRLQVATASMQSIIHTIQREFGVAEIFLSCGWSSIHLNSTLMVLLRTLRQYTKEKRKDPLSRRFLDQAVIDISSHLSGIDFHNEYRILLNPADVPIQWVEIMEKIDPNMMYYMSNARESLKQLEQNAARSMPNVRLKRGYTCSAISFRSFLQNLLEDNHLIGQEGKEGHVVHQVLVCVEDTNVGDAKVLENGSIQIPYSMKRKEFMSFLKSNQNELTRQMLEHTQLRTELEQLIHFCCHTFEFESLELGKGIPLYEGIRCCQELLKLSSRDGRTSSRFAKEQDLSLELFKYQPIRISRSYGLDQDGTFLLPVDWFI